MASTMAPEPSWGRRALSAGAIIWTYGKCKGSEGHLTKSHDCELRTR